MAPSSTRISPTMPPSRLWTTWVCRDGTTRPLPRLTSSRIAKCAQTRNVTRRPREVSSNMREVRGVRRLAAARMSLAKAKSDCGMGLLNHGCSLRKIGLGRAFGWGWRRFALQERQNLVSRSVGDQAAVVKQQQSVHQAEQRKPVGGDDDGHPIGTDRLQAFQKLGLAADVEVCRRLVEEEDLGLFDQPAGQSDGLFLAPGQTACA